MAWKKKQIKKWCDGDTPQFTDKTFARLNRVRCPEKYQYGGPTATKTAAGMTGRTKGFVYVKQIARDKYGRPIIEMKNKEGSINIRMRNKGYKNKGR